jgi:hypothetical protein
MSVNPEFQVTVDNPVFSALKSRVNDSSSSAGCPSRIFVIASSISGTTLIALWENDRVELPPKKRSKSSARGVAETR